MEQHTVPFAAEAIARVARRIDRPVVLVGMMGAGKSTVGRKLAAILGVPFADADAEVEKAAQMSIAEIFETYGEANFRSGERRVIERLLRETPPGKAKVLATGGGAFIDPQTRALILGAAIAVWLDADIDTLVARVARRSHRPLLRGGDPREILTRLHAERAPAYGEAPIRVTSDGAPHHQTALAILQAIDQWR